MSHATTGRARERDFNRSSLVTMRMGTDNQQERIDAQWIVGFVDGEGCFHVAINRQLKMTLGWQVLPEFRVVQHQRDEQILHRIRAMFGFGQVVVNHGDRKEFRVRGKENLSCIVEFFQTHPLQTKKQKDFEAFARIVAMMNAQEHLTRDGLDHIARLIETMNEQTQPAYLESSETIRQTREEREDIVRPAQRCAEARRNDVPA